MRVVQSLFRSAAAAGLVSLAAACVIPPPGVGPRPEEEQLPAPDVAFYNFDSAPYGAGSGIIAYSITRDAYAAAFEVDQQGRVRVLSPSSPKADMRTTEGKSFVLYPQLRAFDREFLSPSTDFSRVPFVFVLTADTPLDLSAFGTGRSWSRDVVVGARDPDSTIADVARRVLADAPAYGSDFAYVGPLLRAGERQFVSQCARSVEDVHDYNYYRDLWAVFTPADQRLSINMNWMFTPALAWSSYSLLPLAAYRAQFATNAFYGGCSGSPSLYYGGSLASGYPGAAFLGGVGAYGYGYGYPYGYPYGTGVVPIGRPGQRVAPPLRLPRTPVAFGTTQIAGATGAPGAQTLGAHVTGLRPAGSVPPQFGWRPLDGRRGPGEFQPSTRPILGENGAGLVRPTFRHGFEPRAYTPRPMDTETRGGGGRAFSDVHQTMGGGSGQAVARPQPTFTQPTFTPRASAPMSSPPMSSPSTGAGAASTVQARSEAKAGHN